MAEFTVPALDLAAERLSKLFPSSDETRTLSDAEIEQVATLLEGQNEVYSQAPRAYIVLWIIGRLDILGDLLKSGFSDFCFPVESTSLPPSLDPAVRRAIVQTQHVVLTKSVDLEKGENGKHRHFGKEDPLPFKTLRRLGAGGYSQVDLIKSRISCKQYALKRIPRRTAFWNNSKQAVRQFAAEMQLIKALKHRHIVQFVGSFTDPKYLGMIISPVADMNLAEYMDLMAAQKAPPNLTSLRSFFGCLATALQYLHDQSIRHRDIKPQNILIDGGNVLFTDFGLSKDYSDHAGSTTSGVTAMTPRYSAPEVAAGDSRNTSADIWSLGCVFLEMVVVLKRHSTEWMRGYFSDNGTKEPYASRNPDATSTIIARLRETGSLQDNKMLDLSQSMLSFDRESRPTAAEVVITITTPSGDDLSATMFCGICCLAEEALSDSNDSLADDIQTTPGGPRQPFPRHDSTKKTIQTAIAPVLESSGQILRLREDSLAQDLTNTPEASSTKASTTDNSSNSHNGSALSEWDSSFEHTIEHTIDNDFSLTPFTVDYWTLQHDASKLTGPSSSSAPEVMEEDSVPTVPLELHPSQGSSQPGFQLQSKSSASEEATGDGSLVPEFDDSTNSHSDSERATCSDQEQLLSLFEAITDPSLFPGAEEIHHTWANNPWEERPRVVQTEEPESQESFEPGEPDSSSTKEAIQKPRSRALMRKAFSAVQLSSEKYNNQSQGAWWRLVRGRGGSEGKIPNNILDQSLKPKKEITKLSPSVISGSQSQPCFPIFGNRLHKCVFTGVNVQYLSGVTKEDRVAYLPIVVVECVSFLKTAGHRQSVDFHIPKNDLSLGFLTRRFETAPHFGLGQEWPPFSTEHTASLLLYFLRRLGDPLIPFKYFEAFCIPCAAKSSFSEAKKLTIFRKLIGELYPVQRDLLLYVLDFFRAFSSTAADMELLALRFLNVFFRGPSSLTSLFDGSDIRTLLSTIVFLIDHHNGLVSDEHENAVERKWLEETGPFEQRVHQPSVLVPTTTDTNVVLAV